MRASFLAIAAFFFAASDAIAADVPAAAAVTVEAQKAGEDKPVCRTERSLGTRVVKRVCKTAAQREKEEFDARTSIKLGSGRKGQPTEAFKRPGE